MRRQLASRRDDEGKSHAQQYDGIGRRLLIFSILSINRRNGAWAAAEYFSRVVAEFTDLGS